MITVTLEKVLLAKGSLERISEEKINARARLIFGHILSKIEPEFQNYKNVRNQLITEIGEEKDGMPQISANSREFKIFQIEDEKILKQEIGLAIDRIDPKLIESAFDAIEKSAKELDHSETAKNIMWLLKDFEAYMNNLQEPTL